NGKPVNVTEQARNNVVIAATGTGVTLTATPQGEGDDTDGHYWKYSLQPDTASYATQAIRYNTVTVEVNGAKVGTEYHAAWSPDVVLGGGDSLPYTMNEVQDIIQSCQDPIVSMPENGHANMRVYSAVPASTRIRCGTDPATALAPYILVKGATEPTAATVTTTVRATGTGGFHDGALRPQTTTKQHTTIKTAAEVDISVKGGVDISKDVKIVKGEPTFPSARKDASGHPFASIGTDAVLGITQTVPVTGKSGYYADLGSPALQYIGYDAARKATWVVGRVQVDVTGTASAFPDTSSQTDWTLFSWDVEYRVNTGISATGLDTTDNVISGGIVDVPGVTGGILYSDTGKDSYTYVQQNVTYTRLLKSVKTTENDIIGTTSPTLTGTWAIYTYVQ
ncbi:hypothetical protein WM620_005039, partial [Salmonella enterica]